MKIELKNLKHSSRFSEETLQFVANIYVDGKKVGFIENDGRGGCSDYRFSDSSTEDLVSKFVDNLPPDTYEFNNETHSMKYSVESYLYHLACEIVDEKERVKENKRLIKMEEKFRKEFSAKGRPVLVKVFDEKKQVNTYYGLVNKAQIQALAQKLNIAENAILEV